MTHALGQHSGRRVRGLSLVEIVVVFAVVVILGTMGYSALSRGRQMSKGTVCQSNLKQISAALGLYYNDYRAYPSDDLPLALGGYVGGGSKLFLCPSDPNPEGDSYSEFYVSRAGQSTQDYVCGCPRHVDERKAITLFCSSSVQAFDVCPVQWNGQDVPVGTSVTSGVIGFSDGSRVTVPEGMVVRLIQSFRMHDGRLYSLIGVGINETGTLDVEVTPGSRFEVVTPAAIAGVQGTRFHVQVALDGGLYCVNVSVAEGKVLVKDRWADGLGEQVVAGKAKKVKKNRKEVNKKLLKKWKKRRKHLADDKLYSPDSSTTDTRDDGNDNDDDNDDDSDDD